MSGSARNRVLNFRCLWLRHSATERGYDRHSGLVCDRLRCLDHGHVEACLVSQCVDLAGLGGERVLEAGDALGQPQRVSVVERRRLSDDTDQRAAPRRRVQRVGECDATRPLSSSSSSSRMVVRRTDVTPPCIVISRLLVYTATQKKEPIFVCVQLQGPI